MHPVIVRDLEPGPGCLPTLISKKRGRPQTTRIRKEESLRKRRLSVQICGVDNKVTINVAVEQLTITWLQNRERTVILR
jgi:hypothetical protein